MLNLIKKDFLLTFSTKASIFLIALYIPLMNLIMGGAEPETIISIMIVSLVYILTIIPLSYERKDKSHMLIQSLPVRRKDVVISKYISVFINFILGNIIIACYLWIVSLFGIRIVDSLGFSVIISTLPIVILSLSIALPIQIRAPFKIANFFNGAMLGIIINSLSGNIVNTSSNSINDPRFLVIIIAIVYLASMILSIWIYEEQELI